MGVRVERICGKIQHSEDVWTQVWCVGSRRAVGKLGSANRFDNPLAATQMSQASAPECTKKSEHAAQLLYPGEKVGWGPREAFSGPTSGLDG